MNYAEILRTLTCGVTSYHSQSPEALFSHIPGLHVVIPRSPLQAKGLLLSAIRTNDPVMFMEPKVLYRAAVEQVPVDAYQLPLGKAEILKPGKNVTIVSYGTPLYTCAAAIAAAEKDFGCSVELIDLRTIYPWDRQTVLDSVKKTGRAIVVHESMMNAGVGAEVAATIQERAFLRLEAPVKRVTGWATHTGLIFEKFIIPDVTSKFTLCSYGESTDCYRGIRCNQKDHRLLKLQNSAFNFGIREFCTRRQSHQPSSLLSFHFSPLNYVTTVSQLGSFTFILFLGLLSSSDFCYAVISQTLSLFPL